MLRPVPVQRPGETEITNLVALCERTIAHVQQGREVRRRHALLERRIVPETPAEQWNARVRPEVFRERHADDVVPPVDVPLPLARARRRRVSGQLGNCLLYTSDAADERS